MQDRYLNPHQARTRQPTPFEDMLGDSIERAFAAGIHELPGLIAHLNRTGPNCPTGHLWTEDSYKTVVAHLAEKC
ncbi:MAG: hypothetical protein JWQ00_81 [Noviherbaspirillum sp.]|jgi:hypothetical protein|nr:hypothetical protein [Noviherbaspirillum sp.]